MIMNLKDVVMGFIDAGEYDHESERCGQRFIDDSEYNLLSFCDKVTNQIDGRYIIYLVLLQEPTCMQ